MLLIIIRSSALKSPVMKIAAVIPAYKVANKIRDVILSLPDSETNQAGK